MLRGTALALYEVVVYGNISGQLTVNRFHYRSDESPDQHTGAEGLAEALGLSIDQVPPVTSTLIGQWATLVSSAFAFTEFIVRDMYSNVNFFAAPFAPPLSGSTSSDVEAPFVSYGFSSNRVRSDIRRGQKRFAGVTENAVNAAGVITTAQLGELETLASRMDEIVAWTEGEETIAFTPVILGLERHEPDPPERPTV